MSDQLDREIDALDEALANGDITNAEYDAELREIRRDYQAAREESAQRAYDNEFDRW